MGKDRGTGQVDGVFSFEDKRGQLLRPPVVPLSPVFPSMPFKGADQNERKNNQAL